MTKTSKYHHILTGDVKKSLISMTNSISLGFISLFTFNLIDTYFISKLGSDQLAAVSFTFPISFLIMNIFFGINTGITAQIGKSIGNKNTNTNQTNYLILNSIIFIIILSILFCLIGYNTIDLVFKFLGAEDKILFYIKQYISYWYFGFIFLAFAMASGAVIRGFGDAKTPSRVLLFSSFINGILDPLLIFGLGPFPRLEIKGAIISTVVAWIGAAILSVYNIKTKTDFFNKKLVTTRYYKINFKKYFYTNIKNILSIGGPSIATNMINPIASSIIIKIVAMEGLAVVAAFGVGLRLEALAILFSISMSIAMVPFVSINHGAKNKIRINQGLKYAIKSSLIIQLFIYLVLFTFANPLAYFFTDDQEIANIIILYLRILPGVYCFMGMIMIILSTLNAIEQAKYSTLINIIRFFVLTIPLAYLGQYFYGVLGILIGIALAKIWAFVIAIIIYKKISK